MSTPPTLFTEYGNLYLYLLTDHRAVYKVTFYANFRRKQGPFQQFELKDLST